MAQGFIQLPTDAGGKMLAADTWAQSANTVYGQNMVLYGPDGNPLATATAALAGGEKGLITRSYIQGSPLPTDTGTITSPTSVVSGTTDVSNANNTTVLISGTYAGVNVTFEASDDSGTTWLPVAGVRDDSGIAETTSGVMLANQSRAWNFGLNGYNRFRVRATAWTSGTATVTVDPGTFPFEPFISNVNSVPNRTILVLATATAGVTPAASEALVTMAQCQRGYAALSSGTSFALTAGKIFRVQAMTLGVRASTTTAVTATAVLRFNPTGAATTSSPVVATLTASSPGAVAAEGGQITVAFPDGKDLVAGTTPGQVGVSMLGTTATGLAVISVEGYEYG